MVRRLLVTLCSLLASSVTGQSVDDAPARLHPDVEALLARESRQQGMERILARGAYRGEPAYEEGQRPFRVGHVVVCPQQRGLPMFAVFGVRVADPSVHRARGHLIQVASDGVIVRCWQGNNVVDDAAVFADVNLDGVVERIETMNYRFGERDETVRELFVLPVVEGATPSLRVAIEVSARQPAREPQMGWRVEPGDAGQPATIRIGRKDVETGGLKDVIAEWRWQADRSTWIGPGGGPDQEFVRLPPDGTEELEAFAAARRR